ncbi:formylglycine-generating enzyme family protein [Sphingomonas mucosissima]|uniref:Serine/threonine-protein kinase pkn1 n=1 Tax=Sphingomonas mucosissima TaxID=370959 RepID=A0A245ZJP9_9SPHN|nr:formylglycine-generating enzyme family protein [Sphingomonas mucosissima]OWK29945.1 serine/threonine-protein kinase pkn1 [Sphingomonas mucosissima]
MTETLDLVPMVTVPSGTFLMGASDHYPEEAPVRSVDVAAFRIDRHPVTNRQFARFVTDTGYETVAERPLDPATYPGIEPDRLMPGALVFRAPKRGTPAKDVGDWWAYVPGAHWRRPEAAATVFAGRLDHPVVCVAYEDAAAYATWAGKRLPTEAEWERAARGGIEGATYAWGAELTPGGKRMANIWMGDFPRRDLRLKGHRTTRVGSFPPNGFGLVDMIGNVWEWTGDWYSAGPKADAASSCCSPPTDSYDPAQPLIRIPRRVLKGGSFLCAPNYCARYRPAARQAQMIDTASVHIGFRCASEAD